VFALLAMAVSPAFAHPLDYPPRPIGDPALWIGAADYPPVARRLMQSGDVFVRLDVGTEGRVSKCVIERGSGYAALDEKTCALLFERARFQPGADPAGRATTSVWRQRIRWMLDEELSAPPSALSLP
jgi:periplasmic protein TonB